MGSSNQASYQHLCSSHPSKMVTNRNDGELYRDLLFIVTLTPQHVLYLVIVDCKTITITNHKHKRYHVRKRTVNCGIIKYKTRRTLYKSLYCSLDNKIKEEANCLCNIKYFLWLSCFNAVSNIINFDHFHNTLNTLTKEHKNMFIWSMSIQ